MGTDSSAFRRPDWSLWRDMAHAEMEVLVALSIDVDPYDSSINNHPEFRRRLVVARNHERALEREGANEEAPIAFWVGDGQPSPPPTYTFRSFAVLCDQLRWPLPKEFPHESSAAREGRTKLLRILAAADRQWWSTFVPEQPRTAPTNDEVEGWLKKHGVTGNIAAAMATILRDDRLKDSKG
jgi:hypothetical protein